MSDTEDKQSSEVNIAKHIEELVQEDERDIFNRLFDVRADSTNEYIKECAEDWVSFQEQYAIENGEKISDAFMTYKNLNTVTGAIIGGGIGLILGTLAANGIQEEVQALYQNYMIHPDLINTLYYSLSIIPLVGLVAKIFEHMSPHFFTRKIKKEYQVED